MWNEIVLNTTTDGYACRNVLYMPFISFYTVTKICSDTWKPPCLTSFFIQRLSRATPFFLWSWTVLCCDGNAISDTCHFHREITTFFTSDLLPFCSLRHTILRKVARLPHLEVTCCEINEAGLGSWLAHQGSCTIRNTIATHKQKSKFLVLLFLHIRTSYLK